jgi:hypothetical protein
MTLQNQIKGWVSVAHTCNLGPGQPGQNRRTISKIITAKRVEGMAPATEHLPSKCGSPKFKPQGRPPTKKDERVLEFSIEQEKTN